MRRSVAVAAGVAALLLTACARDPEQPGGVTAEEAQQLNDAAAMLDANSMDANALATNASETE
jgi:outer membrane biogenesis lipoprotein LolB